MRLADERLIDALPALVLLVSDDGRIDCCNRRWTDYTGMSPEAAASGWAEAIHPDELAQAVALLRRLRELEGVEDAELRLRGVDGAFRWFMLRVAPHAGEAQHDHSVLLFFDVNASHEREQLLSARERDARLTINSIPGLVVTMRPDGELEFANEPLLERLGQPLDELRKWGSNGTLHPDDVERVGQAWMETLASGGPYDIEHRIRCADGEYRWFHVRGRAQRDAAGQLVRWYNVISDIDAQKTTEERLRRSEARLSQALNVGRIGTWSFDVATGALALSSSARVQQSFGVDSSQELATGFSDMMHPDDRERVIGEFQRCVREQAQFQVQYRMRLSDGSIRYHQSFGGPLLDERGKMVEFIGTGVDVTEQTLARQALEDAVTALRASEQALSLIVETIPAFVWCASPDGAITYINQRLLERLGTTLERATSGWHDLVHPDERDAVLRAWAQAVATSEPYSRPFRMRHGDQAHHWVQAMAQLGRDESGAPTLWYGLLIDIDEQRRAEEALKETRARLARAARVATVAELSASIAHEVNQPLVAIVSNAQACVNWLATSPPNLDKARRSAETIVRDGVQAGETIARLRNLFQRQAVQRVPLPINELVRDVVELVLAEAAERQIMVETALEPSLLAIPGDRIQLQQVVLNLLNNALDAVEGFTQRERKVTVRSSRLPGAVLIEVEDSGIGLNDPVKVFEPFFTTKANGLGVGLAICRWVIEGHGGKLWAENHEQHGASFFFTLPLDTGA